MTKGPGGEATPGLAAYDCPFKGANGCHNRRQSFCAVRCAACDGSRAGRRGTSARYLQRSPSMQRRDFLRHVVTGVSGVLLSRRFAHAAPLASCRSFRSDIRRRMRWSWGARGYAPAVWRWGPGPSGTPGSPTRRGWGPIRSHACWSRGTTRTGCGSTTPRTRMGAIRISPPHSSRCRGTR